MSVTGPQLDAQPTPADPGADNDRLMAMFDRWDKALTAKWSEWQEEAKSDFDFAAGRQWTDEDKAALEEAQKVPVVFNLTDPTLEAVRGAEIQNRQQVQYFPRQVESSGISDALTQGAEYVNDECNGDQEDSEAFYDTLVCGIGWTVTQPDVDADEVEIIKERVDPLQMKADPNSRKRCFEDARYLKREIPMGRDEFEDFKDSIGKPDAEGGDQGLGNEKRVTIVNPEQRYTNGMRGEGEGDDEDTVIVCEWQWWEKEPVHMTAVPRNDGSTQIVPLSPDEHGQAQGFAQQAGMGQLKSTQTTRKVYYRAMVGDGEVLLHEPLKERQFRYKAITGKRDRNKGTWFGLVRAMKDPQRFTNKLYSEILHIIRTNAKGGLMVEEGAVADVRQFEDTYAQADAITWVPNGSLSQNRMQPKIPPPIPPSLFQMMEWARDMVQKCTGVNEEVLGLVGRDQAGVLEYQRKQAAYGILSAFFDAKRRYTRDQGKLLLEMMRLYLPADKLLPIVDQGTRQYVAVAETLQAGKYDVVVDEAPAGPNQKARVMQVLGPWIGPMVEGGIIGPDAIADIMPYMDLPAVVANKLAEAIRTKAQSAINPQAQQFEQQMAQATLDEKHASAEHKRAQAFAAVSDAHVSHAQLGRDFLVAEHESQAAAEQPGPMGQPQPPPGTPAQQP